MGTSGVVPMFTISSDLYYNLYQLERLFKNVESDKLEESNSRFKNVNAIFGISYGFDGFTLNIGVNLAGITIKLPILFSQDFPDVEESTSSDYLHHGAWIGVVLGYFLGTTYLFKKLVKRRKDAKKKRRGNA